MEVEKFYPAGNNARSRHSFYSSAFSTNREDRAMAGQFENGIDLNELFIRNKPSTFFMQVTGSSMCKANIDEGDILVVDRSIKARSGSIVIAVVEGDMLLRRLEKTMNKTRLIAESAKIATMEMSDLNELQVWGVVTFVIKQVG